MARSRIKPPSQRQLRAGENIRHHLSMLMSKIIDESGRSFASTTIAQVELSPDLRHGKVYIMTFGGNNIDETLEALNKMAPQLSHEVGRKLSSKFTPRLKFVKDDSFEYAGKINNVLQRVKRGDD